MKKQALIIAGIAVLTLGASIGVVSADTWNGSTGTSGAWSGTDDGATQVTATIAPSYTVTIPDSLTLPTTATYTENEDNVAVLAGAHVAEGNDVYVGLAANQTFAVTSSNGADTVPYNVKINQGTPIGSTSDYWETVLYATAAEAHAGKTSSLNVGFATPPSFVFAGAYTQTITFAVGEGQPEK